MIEKLLSGQSIALVSDAGTPGISDPAFHVVQQALEKGIPIIPIPGPTAFISALISSGLPTDRFVFEGFLPQKKGRKTKLEALKSESRTIIFLRILSSYLENTCRYSRSFWQSEYCRCP
jgi:16S rRNA (cytidine1402-2'-O)-methyltransferase